MVELFQFIQRLISCLQSSLPELFMFLKFKINALTSTLIFDNLGLNLNYQNAVSKYTIPKLVKSFHWLSIGYIFNMIYVVDNVIYVS